MTKILRIGALVLTCFLFSCEKEKSTDEETSGSGSGNDYQPTTAGSEWRMSSTTAGDYTITALAGDTVIGGKKFFKFDNSSSEERVYINKDNGVYTQYAPIPIGDESFEMIVLKDAPVGTTWKSRVDFQGFFNEFTYKVVSRDADKTVNGKTYNNVITVAYEVTMPNPLGGGTLKFATGRAYYSKGIGPIASSFKMDFMGNEREDSTYLASYIIK